jgi:3-oxoacyl-[acyl-carrier-protein] synthase-3
MAADSIRAGSNKQVLVIGAETMSRVMDWQDRTTSILFGDGAGAIVLQASHDEGGVLSAVLCSDGAGYDLLGIPMADSPYNNGHKIGKMFMIGGEVFKFATRVITESVTEAVYKAGITLDDVALIIPHQANDRILMAAARSLNMDKDKFMSNVERYGNTSAASIPIALYEAVQEGRVHEGDSSVCVGFGGGFSWGAVVIKWRVPRPENIQSSRVAQSRRRVSYFRARLRERWRYWRRRLSSTFSRIRPNYGRIPRLRSKIEEYDFDD